MHRGALRCAPWAAAVRPPAPGMPAQFLLRPHCLPGLPKLQVNRFLPPLSSPCLACLQEKMGAPWAHWGVEGNRFAPVAAYMKRTIRDVRRKVKQLQAAEAEAVAAGEWRRGRGLGGCGPMCRWMAKA